MNAPQCSKDAGHVPEEGARDRGPHQRHDDRVDRGRAVVVLGRELPGLNLEEGVSGGGAQHQGERPVDDLSAGAEDHGCRRPKPTATAPQRRGPTRSPSIGTESATTMSGAVKKAIVNAVSGTWESAMM